jgi:hypothetical protein
MPWIKEERLYFYIVMLLILIMAIRMPLDSDMWWHLKAGEQTWLDKQVYDRDTFSSTRYGQDWINHSWLSQLLMYLIFTLGGFYGLSFWVALCAALSMALIYPQMEGHPLLRGLVLLLAGVVASVVWSPRPQVMSLLLLSVLSYLLYAYKKNGNPGVLLWTLPLFVLWANLHGGFVLGFMLLGANIAGEILNQLLAREHQAGLGWKQIGTLTGLLVAAGLVVLINPFGAGIWKIPFNTVGVEALQNLISEWASPDFHQLFQQPFLWLLFLEISAMALSDLPVEGTELAGMILFGWAALTARRNFGPFAIIVSPGVSRHLSAFLKSWLKDASKRYSLIGRIRESMSQKRDFTPGIRNAVNTILLCLLIFAAGWKTFSVNQPELRKNAELSRYPVQATTFLSDHQPEGYLFNEYNWGGYLIWNLPAEPVFIDGRTDLFGDEILEDYLDIRQGREGWDSILKEYGITSILLSRDAPLVTIAGLEGWRIVYQDTQAAVLIQGE